METLISIFREVRDPRDFNAQHDLAAMLFIALAATLCGAKSCVDFADFAAADVELLAEIVDLPHGAPSHDCFSRLFRLLDPEEMAQVFARFVAALREGLGLGPVKGVVAVRNPGPPTIWRRRPRVSLARNPGRRVHSPPVIERDRRLHHSLILRLGSRIHPPAYARAGEARFM